MVFIWILIQNKMGKKIIYIICGRQIALIDPMSGLPEFTQLSSIFVVTSHSDLLWPMDVSKGKASRGLKITHSFPPALSHNWSLFFPFYLHHENMPNTACLRKRQVGQNQVSPVEARDVGDRQTKINKSIQSSCRTHKSESLQALLTATGPPS